VALAPGTWPRPLLHAIRLFNKHVLNRLMVRRSGRPNAHAGVIRHTGRTSGRQYSTPVGVEQTADGFVLPVAYGTQADWLKNVLAAGRATVVTEGTAYDVVAPKLLDAATALPMLPAQQRRTFERIGIPQYLYVLRDAGSTDRNPGPAHR
jgi:deazaflavin-dependent oxidoreductase (nitroreductase family)